MRFNKLDLNLIVALDALLQEKNVTRAAERVFLSQSAMSHALSRLKKYFDDPLLVRVGSNLQLTPRAEALVEPTRDILLRVSTMLDIYPKFDPAEAVNRFVISMTEYTGVMLLPSLMQRLRVKAPEIKVSILDHRPTTELGLDTGEVHIVVTQPELAYKNYSSTRLFEDEWVCAVSPSHPKIKTKLELDDIEEFPHVVFLGEKHISEQAFENELIQINRSRTKPFTVASLQEMHHIIQETDVLGILPKLYCDKIETLMSFELPVPIPHKLSPTMYWHAAKNEDPAHKWLRDQIIEIGEEIGCLDKQ